MLGGRFGALGVVSLAKPIVVVGCWVEGPYEVKSRYGRASDKQAVAWFKWPVRRNNLTPGPCFDNHLGNSNACVPHIQLPRYFALVGQVIMEQTHKK